MKETPKRRRRLFPRTLAECNEGVLKPVFTKHGLMETRIIRDWPKIVGDALALHSSPQKLSFSKSKKDGGSLHLQCDAAHALTLEYQKPLIIEKLAVYFGYKAIDRIVVNQVHIAENTSVSFVLFKHRVPTPTSDDPLVAALERLHAAMD